MAFTTFKNLADVLKKHRLRYQEEDFAIVQSFSAPEVLREDVLFTLDKVAYDVSEAAICENLLYPVLKSAWKPSADVLSIWSHQPLASEGDFVGTPDYVVSKKSALGKIVFESPFVAVVEAKKDDFTAGWAQCGVEMLAMQTINDDKNLPVHGIVSNGETWEFARLNDDIFLKFKQLFFIHNLDQLYSALRTVFDFYEQKFKTT